MKKKITMFLIMLMGIMLLPLATHKNVQAASASKMKTAYKKFLKNKASANTYYTFSNIGPGNKPALLIGKTPNPYGAGGYLSCYVYYYKKGKVKYIGTMSGAGRQIGLTKKGGQYYLAGGNTSDAIRVCVKSNKLYKCLYYNSHEYKRIPSDKYQKAKIKLGNKTIKVIGYLDGITYGKYRGSYKFITYTVNFYKNPYKTKTTSPSKPSSSTPSTIKGSIKISGGSIGSNNCTFKICKKLKTLKVNSTSIQKVEGNALKGTAKNLVIKVPKSKKKAYTKLFKGKGNKTVKIK